MWDFLFDLLKLMIFMAQFVAHNLIFDLIEPRKKKIFSHTNYPEPMETWVLKSLQV